MGPFLSDVKRLLLHLWEEPRFSLSLSLYGVEELLYVTFIIWKWERRELSAMNHTQSAYQISQSPAAREWEKDPHKKCARIEYQECKRANLNKKASHAQLTPCVRVWIHQRIIRCRMMTTDRWPQNIKRYM